MKKQMDEVTRRRYIVWRRKRIIKRIVIPGAILVLFLTIGIKSLMLHLRQDDPIEELVEKVSYIAIDPCENLDLSPLTSALEQYGNEIAIYFENLATGCNFSHRAQEEFFGASIMKAPFALWLYTQAELGYIDLEDVIYFTEDDHLGGSGIIRHNYGIGEAFTIRRLIGLNLYESDNVATHMLRRTFSHTGYVELIVGLGVSREDAGNILYSRVTAKEVGSIARAIYDYLESNRMYSAEFKYNLLNNQFPFITSNYPVASKTGWYHRYGGAWHDMAIIYAPSPFSLVILSSDRTGTEEDHQAYAYITRAFENFNRLNFSLYQPNETSISSKLKLYR